MPASDDLQDFHRYLGDRIRDGVDGLSPEDVLDEWREVHPDEDSLSLSTEEIKDVLADLDSGEQGLLWEDFDREFRLKHGLSGS